MQLGSGEKRHRRLGFTRLRGFRGPNIISDRTVAKQP